MSQFAEGQTGENLIGGLSDEGRVESIVDKLVCIHLHSFQRETSIPGSYSIVHFLFHARTILQKHTYRFLFSTFEHPLNGPSRVAKAFFFISSRVFCEENMAQDASMNLADSISPKTVLEVDDHERQDVREKCQEAHTGAELVP